MLFLYNAPPTGMLYSGVITLHSECTWYTTKKLDNQFVGMSWALKFITPAAEFPDFQKIQALGICMDMS
jgi:hypothetical protein